MFIRWLAFVVILSCVCTEPSFSQSNVDSQKKIDLRIHVGTQVSPSLRVGEDEFGNYEPPD